MINKKHNSRGLGWFLGAILCVMFASSSAGATDFSKEIARQDSDSSQILSTLGRGARVGANSQRKGNKVQLKLIPARKASKRR